MDGVDDSQKSALTHHATVKHSGLTLIIYITYIMNIFLFDRIENNIQSTTNTVLPFYYMGHWGIYFGNCQVFSLMTTWPRSCLPCVHRRRLHELVVIITTLFLLFNLLSFISISHSLKEKETWIIHSNVCSISILNSFSFGILSKL